MSIDPHEADPADLADQEHDVVAPVVDDEVPARDPEGLPLEADEADVAEQRSDLPDWDDER